MKKITLSLFAIVVAVYFSTPNAVSDGISLSIISEDEMALSSGDCNVLYTQVFKNWHQVYCIQTDSCSIPTDSTIGKAHAKIAKTEEQITALRQNGYKWDVAHFHEACKCRFNEYVDDDHKIPVVSE